MRLPDPVALPLRITFGQDRHRPWAEASTVLSDGVMIRARQYPPHGVPELYSQQKHLDNWMHQTACRAVDELLLRVLNIRGPRPPESLALLQRFAALEGDSHGAD